MSETVELYDARSGAVARFAVDRGLNCYAFRVPMGDRVVEVIDAPADFPTGEHRASGYGIPILFPFPNRIRNGRYTWDGRSYEMLPSAAPFDGEGNAIHGFCLDRAWRVIGQEPTALAAEFQLSREAPDRLAFWPEDFLLRVRYSLDATILRADFEIVNPGSSPLPWGLGTHPYFRLPLTPDGSATECLVRVPAEEQWELVSCLPTGVRRKTDAASALAEGICWGERAFDDVFGGLRSRDGVIEASITDPAARLSVVQRTPVLFREMVVYTPPGRSSVCLEPYTCVTDAIHLQEQGVDAGWRVLAPGEAFRTWIEIALVEISA